MGNGPLPMGHNTPFISLLQVQDIQYIYVQMIKETIPPFLDQFIFDVQLQEKFATQIRLALGSA